MGMLGAIRVLFAISRDIRQAKIDFEMLSGRNVDDLLIQLPPLDFFSLLPVLQEANEMLREGFSFEDIQDGMASVFAQSYTLELKAALLRARVAEAIADKRREKDGQQQRDV